jgi:hypothetical protein
VAYTLYADAFDQPIYADPALKTTHDNMMKGYERSIGSSWPFYADVGWTLEPYFDTDGLPLVVLVDTATMTILHGSVGHHAQMIKDMILAFVSP